MLSSDIQHSHIQQAIDKRKTIRVKSYAMLDNTEELLKDILQKILNVYDKPQLMEAIYTTVKELAINAVKANMKRLTFQEHGLDIDDPQQAQQGHKLFHERIAAISLEDYAQGAQKAGYTVFIDFIFGGDHFLIEIKNNSLLSSSENQRIRQNLSKAMSFEDIAEFYHQFSDDSEGAGLGMTMITMALKSEGIDPHCFTIFADGEFTTARLEIPITDKYIPRRKRFKE